MQNPTTTIAAQLHIGEPDEDGEIQFSGSATGFARWYTPTEGPENGNWGLEADVEVGFDWETGISNTVTLTFEGRTREHCIAKFFAHVADYAAAEWRDDQHAEEALAQWEMRHDPTI
jgi:hypothetical protein